MVQQVAHMTDDHDVAGSNPVFRTGKCMAHDSAPTVLCFRLSVNGALGTVNDLVLESSLVRKKRLFRHRDMLKSMKKVGVKLIGRRLSSWL